MPLTGVYGKGGSGKNTIVTWFLKKYFSKITKYVNFRLKLPNTKQIDSVSLFELPETNRPVITVWDEAYTELDNRDFMTERNRINNFLLFQSRKNNMSIIAISQLNILDVRWRNLEENAILCLDRPIYDKNFNHYKGDFRYIYYKNGKYRKFRLKYKEAYKVFQYFETKQKILPKNFEEMKHKVLMQNPKEVLKYVDGIAQEIIQNYGAEKYTHDQIKNMMLELGYIEFKYEPLIYIRTRSKVKR